ncbi:MAG: helix-turn-helix transcriptional regulator [Pseudonocardiales bacterium]
MAVKRRALADRRRAVGHTQESLAALLGVERSTVVRWEAGETEPLPVHRPQLAEALAVSLDKLHELLATLDDVPAQHSDALLLSLTGNLTSAQIGTLMERFAAMDISSRREVLQELLIMSGATLLEPVRRWLAQALAVVPLVTPETLGSDALDALERAVTVFRRWDSAGVGGLHRKAVVGQLNAVTETLREPHSPEVSQRLFQIAAELAQVAGWVSFDQDLPGAAQRYYLLGLNACQEARSPALAAKILGDMSRLSTKYHHYDDGLDLIRTGLYILPRHGGELVRTELLGVESRTHARLGNQAAATRAADACIEVWQEASSEPIPDWQHYMGVGEADGLVANAYILLALRAEDSNRAMAHAERAERHILSSRTHSYGRYCINDEIRIAQVRLAQRELTESVTAAQTALELAAPTSSILICDSLVRFHGELTSRYPDDVHVIQFGDQLRDYVKRTAPHKEPGIAT